MEQKSLIKKENISISNKIKNHFNHLFNKEKTSSLYNNNVNYTKTSNIKDEFKIKQEILKLQQDYESGKITEEDMSEEDKQKLMELYHEQISTLNNNINTYKGILENYKQKIINIRKQM